MTEVLKKEQVETDEGDYYANVKLVRTKKHKGLRLSVTVETYRRQNRSVGGSSVSLVYEGTLNDDADVDDFDSDVQYTKHLLNEYQTQLNNARN
jgi:hypothetical protein